MREKVRFRLALTLTVLALSGILSRPVQLASAAVSTTYSQDAGGLQKQLDPLVKAWAKHDAKAIDEAGKIFAMPDPSTWFGKYFAKDQVQQLTWDEEAEVNNFVTVTPGMMNILAKGQKFHAKVSRPEASTSTAVQPRTDAIVPVTPVPVEQYELNFIADNGRSFSVLSNFVYVEGAYRYVGKGAYPFWSMPDATRKK
jgi:hypothetical protein